MEWLREHEVVFWWLGAVSLATLLLSVFLLPLLVARMRTDYFVAPAPPESWRRRHPLLRLALRALKNLLALLLLAAGVAMLFLPGQGILTMLAGLALLDFPGKRRVELRLIRQPGVLKAVNWLRRRSRQPPLLVP